MATTPPMIGGSDPAILKSLETQTPSVARTAPATVNSLTGAATSSGSSVSRGLTPQVSGGTVTYNQATQATAGNSVTVTSSASNDPGDVVTIYTSPKAVSVSAINQTVSSYNVTNYAGNEYTDSDVANYLPTFTGNVGAGNLNVTGTVYTSGVSSTGLASLTILNVSTTANLGGVGNVRITGGSNGQVLTTNGSGNLSWTTVSGGGNGSPGGSNTQIQFNDAGAFAGNTGFTFNKTTGIFTSPFVAGNGNGLSNIAGANISGFVPNANVANTAFAVAAANVSGLGNIATINLTGNSSNVLYGNGVFAPVTGGNANTSQISNGNSNVSIPISNDNVYITTNDGNSKQWIFNKDGTLRIPGNVDIVGGINFPQQVSSINWSTYNIELSQYGRINTNVDFFANANTIGALYLKGDGSNIGNIAGANVSGFVPNANVANTAFAVAGSNVSGTVGNANLSQYLAVSDVNNNFSYHVVLSAGSGDKSLHIDADDNLQYNPDSGLLTATRVDATYFVGNLNFSNGYPAANLVGSVSNIVNGNSNVNIATANGNVTINSVGNTTMTITGTGANITGTLTSTGKIGYASGSSVTQLTSRGTGVTINTLAGTIITTSVAMAASEIDTFAVTNSAVDPTSDIILAQIVSPNQGTYDCIANPAVIGGFNPGFFLNIVNISGFTTSDETITIRFMVIKAPNA